SPWHGWIDSLHDSFRTRRRNSAVHARLDRESWRAIARLGGNGKDHFEVVFIFSLRNRDGDHQLELPLRRRRIAPTDVDADRARRWLARSFLFGGRDSGRASV